METEDFFLYLGYQSKPLQCYLEGGKEVHGYVPAIKRATLRRPDKAAAQAEGLVFHRTPVEFDPTDKQLGYVVVLHTKVEDQFTVVKQDFHFPGIMETTEEAEVLKAQLLEGGYKDYLVKNQKFDKVEIEPVLIVAE